MKGRRERAVLEHLRQRISDEHFGGADFTIAEVWASPPAPAPWWQFWRRS